MAQTIPRFRRCPPYTLERRTPTKKLIVTRNGKGSPPYSVKVVLEGELIVHRNPLFETLDDWNPEHRCTRDSLSMRAHRPIIFDVDSNERAMLEDDIQLDVQHDHQVVKETAPYMYEVVRIVEETACHANKICEESAWLSNGRWHVPTLKVKDAVTRLISKERSLYGMYKKHLEVVFALDREALVRRPNFQRRRGGGNPYARIARMMLKRAYQMFVEVKNLETEVVSWRHVMNRDLVKETFLLVVQVTKHVLQKWLKDHPQIILLAPQPWTV